MTSRLASLLVQDGLVSPKKMAEAFQRQVIYGGTLDTILLEMDVLDEPTLVEAMGRAAALPTAGDLPSKEQLDGAGARDWFPQGLSEKFRAVPVSLDGNVLRVLVTDPPDRKQLDELGYMLSRSIDPIVVPEHRFIHAVEMVYGVSVPARFASLAAKVRQRASDAPLKTPQQPPVVVQMDAELPPEAIAAAEASAHRLASTSIPASGSGGGVPTYIDSGRSVVPPEAARPQAPSAAPVVQTFVPAEAARSEPTAVTGRHVVVTDVPMPRTQTPRATVPAAVPAVEMSEQLTPRITPRQADAPQRLTPEVSVIRGSGEATKADAFPLSLADATRRIDDAGDRDAIFEALCRGARSQVDFVALLMVHGELAVGRLALGEAWVPRDAVASLSVALDKPSPFRAASVGKAPYLGRLGEDALSVAALGLLGRKPPLPAVLLPIVLKDRTVALLYGDARGSAIEADLLAGLTTLVAAAGRSFQRLILKQKGADYAKAPASKAGKVSTQVSSLIEAPPARSTPDTGESGGRTWRRPEAEAAGGSDEEPAPKAKMTVKGFPALSAALMAGVPEGTLHDAPTQARRSGPAMTDAEALVVSVMREDENSASSAEALVLLGERAAPVVVAHLPGPLRLDRHTLRGPTPPLVEHGPLLAVLARLGRGAMGPLLSRLNNPSLEVRYYATLACGALRLPEVVPALGQRLVDSDAGVRHAAVTALTGFDYSPELRTLTESLRGELPGPETVRQRYASEALGALRDVPSVPRLIELVKHLDQAVVTAARRALIEITKQDFGTSRWRWRSWWDRHRNEPRVEWMLEGLGHAEAEVRMSASEELRGMTSEYFGYHFDLPKREREEARRKWVDWWRQHGSKSQPEKR